MTGPQGETEGPAGAADAGTPADGAGVTGDRPGPAADPTGDPDTAPRPRPSPPGAADGAPGTPRADPQAVSLFVEAFASQLVEAGLGRMPARVFAALLASEDGVLTSAELSTQLQVSPAAISGAVRYLSSVAMVFREREPGSRRERYRVHRNQWYEMLADRQTVLRHWELTLRDGVSALGPDSKPGRRIAETLEFFVYMKTELAAMMERWRKHRDELFGED